MGGVVVGVRAHTAPMGKVRSGDDVVAAVGDALRAGLDAELRATGGVLAPTVHILAEDLDQPLVAAVTCRRFHRGRDAAAAITELGLLPSAMSATRLVVAWEAQDLNVALEAPVDPDGSALVLLDAHVRGAQRVSWYPLRCRHGQPGEHAVIVAEWAPPLIVEDPPLPDPVAALLAVWRRCFDLDLDATVAHLEAAGYRMRWFVS